MMSTRPQLTTPDLSGHDAQYGPPSKRRHAPTTSHWATIFVLLLVIAGGAVIRIQSTFSTPNFNHERAEGLLMSDPALLFYLTKRIIDGGGLPPDDFRSDRRVEHPDPADLPAMFTIGQEFYLAWGYRFLGGGLPLHVYCVIAMSFFASLAAIGVFGLTRELTGQAGWAAFAALVYGLTPANYRTVGFILMREDFSLPLFAIHLWLTARAVRVNTPSAYALSALLLVAAVSTWHAMVFIVTLETAAVLAWYLRTGRNPLSASGAIVFPALLAAGAVAVPVLRAKWFLLSLPMQMLAGLLLISRIERRQSPGLRLRLFSAFCLLTAAGAFSLLSASDYSHVFDLLWSKLIHLGRLPDDPNALTFDARLLWQGPFGTGSPVDMAWQLGLPGLLTVAALFRAGRNWRHGRGDDRIQILLAFAALSLIVSIFVKRLVVLNGLVAPVIATLLLSRFRRPWPWRTGAAVLSVQAVLLASTIMIATDSTWYLPVESRNLKEFLYWTERNLDGRGAIAADFINSAAILAHTSHPVILQPKYETRSSRRRIERFVTTFFHGSTAEMGVLLKELDCRYLLVDVYVMSASRYQAGLPWRTKPAAGTAAAAFLSSRAEIYGSVPGFRLLYVNKEMPPTWRLYQIQ